MFTQCLASESCQKILKIAKCKMELSQKFAVPLVELAMRLWMANVFFKSGLTKIANWDTTLVLFEYEYAVPFIPVELAAILGTAGELGLTVLLAIGLTSRFAALGLLIMTAVIQFAVFPGQLVNDHVYWAILYSYILFAGPGKISIDHFIKKWFMSHYKGK